MLEISLGAEGRLRVDLVNSGGRLEDWSRPPWLQICQDLNGLLDEWHSAVPGCRVPCWEEAMRGLIERLRPEEGPTQVHGRDMFCISRLVGALTAHRDQRTEWVRCRFFAKHPEQGESCGNPLRVDSVFDAYRRAALLEDLGSDRPLRILDVGADDAGCWLQLDNGTPGGTAPHPFSCVAGIRQGLLSPPRSRYGLVNGRFEIVRPPPEPNRPFAMAIEEYLALDGLRPLRFVSVLRALESLGIAGSDLLKEPAELHQERMSAGGREDVTVHLYNGTIASDGRREPFLLALGNTSEELQQPTTVASLWSRFGLSGLSFEEFLQLYYSGR